MNGHSLGMTSMLFTSQYLTALGLTDPRPRDASTPASPRCLACFARGLANAVR
jgi:hypothetical protein